MAHISTRHLHWMKVPQEFFGEISELPDKRIPLKRVFPDSCDEGFTLVSHVTGHELDFYMDEVVKDAEGDVVAWRFKPVQKGVPVKTVVIVND